MKIRADKRALSEALNAAQKIADPKGHPAIIGCVAMSAHDGAVHVRATNLRTGIAIAVECEVMTPGDVAIDARDAAAIVAAMPDGDVVIDVDPGKSAVFSGGSRGRSRQEAGSVSAADFPTIGSPDRVTWVSADGASIDEVIGAGCYAVHVATGADHRPGICSVLVECVNGTLSAVSTDGARAVIAEREVGMDDFTWLIPSTALPHVRPVLGSGQVDVGLADGCLFVRGQRALVWTQLDDTKMPPVRKVFERFEAIKNVTTVTCARSTVSDALKRMSGAASKVKASNHGGLVVVRFCDGMMQMNTGGGPGAGRAASESIDVGYHEKKDAVIGFGFNILHQAFQSSHDEVTVTFKDEKEGVLVSGVGGLKTKALVMPMRIDK